MGFGKRLLYSFHCSLSRHEEPEGRTADFGLDRCEFASACFFGIGSPFDEITARRLDFYKRNGFKELAEDPEILSSNRKGGHPQCLMGTRPVADLDAYLKEIRDIVYYAGE